MAYPSAQSAQRYLPLLGVLAAGLLLGATLFAALRALEEQSAQASFDRVAGLRLDALETNLALTLNNLDSLLAYYDVTPELNRAEFARFTSILLTHSKAIQSFEWIPRVLKTRREAYEDAARHDGLPSFQFTERIPQGDVVRARKREEYFPVNVVEPVPGNEKAIGYYLPKSPSASEPKPICSMPKKRPRQPAGPKANSWRR